MCSKSNKVNSIDLVGRVFKKIDLAGPLVFRGQPIYIYILTFRFKDVETEYLCFLSLGENFCSYTPLWLIESGAYL